VAARDARVQDQVHLALAADGDAVAVGVDHELAVVEDDPAVGRRGLDVLLGDAGEAVPPMWKVRSVSCVPGSPIDCAAMTPTGSPMSTSLFSARLRP
jgi:hypothetical protein